MIPRDLPMAPTLIREPFHRAGWVFEAKVDGWRMLACKDDAGPSSGVLIIQEVSYDEDPSSHQDAD